MALTQQEVDRRTDVVLIVAAAALYFATIKCGWDPVVVLVTVMSLALTVASNVPYWIASRNPPERRPRPHVLTFVSLGTFTTAVFLQDLALGASLWSVLPLGLSGALNCVNIRLGWKYGKKDINWITDGLSMAMGFVAFYQWLGVPDSEVLQSKLWFIAASSLAFWPAVRKALHDPSSETLPGIIRTATRYALIAVAIEPATVQVDTYPSWFIALSTQLGFDPASLLTVMYPGWWAAVNALFAVGIIVARWTKRSARIVTYG